MPDQVSNAQRANQLVDQIQGRLDARIQSILGAAAQQLERALNEAEDIGRERAIPTADADTVETLKLMVREMLEPLRDTTPGALDIEARSANLVQILIANFHIRLMDEDDESGAGR